MPWTTDTIEINGEEMEIEIEGDVITGGSNHHGSDEPPWADARNLQVSLIYKPITTELAVELINKHGDRWADMLIEVDQNR
jgi:hypothetical protein